MPPLGQRRHRKELSEAHYFQLIRPMLTEALPVPQARAWVIAAISSVPFGRCPWTTAAAAVAGVGFPPPGGINRMPAKVNVPIPAAVIVRVPTVASG